MHKRIVLLILFVCLYLSYKRSNFTNVSFNTAPVPPSCSYPQGHIPGSNILLTTSERNNLKI